MARDGIRKKTSPATGRVSYEARVGYRDGSGARKWISRTFATKQEATKFRVVELARQQKGQYTPLSTTTVAAAGEEFLETMSLEWTSGTRYQRTRQWNKHILPYFGGSRVSQISRTDCQKFINSLVGSGLAPYTVRSIHGLLAIFFSHAVNEELIDRSPARSLVLPSIDAEQRRVWDDVQVVQFLRETIDAPHHAAYYVMLTTGIRVGEMLALRWTNVDLKRGEISITDTMRRQQSGKFRPEPGTKTKGGRLIELTPGCVNALRSHKRKQDAMKDKSPVWDIRNFVISDKKGGFVDRVAFAQELTRQIKVAKLPPLTPHEMRHTAATLMLTAGVPERAVQDMLGHSSQQLMKLYAHVLKKVRTAASSRLADILKNAEDATTSDATTREFGA